MPNDIAAKHEPLHPLLGFLISAAGGIATAILIGYIGPAIFDKILGPSLTSSNIFAHWLFIAIAALSGIAVFQDVPVGLTETLRSTIFFAIRHTLFALILIAVTVTFFSLFISVAKSALTPLVQAQQNLTTRSEQFCSSKHQRYHSTSVFPWDPGVTVYCESPNRELHRYDVDLRR